MEVPITLANLLFVAGFFTKNMLRARVLSVAGTLLLTLYFTHRPEPIWSVIAWNHVFLVLNVWQLFRLLWAQKGQAPTPSRVAKPEPSQHEAPARPPGSNRVPEHQALPEMIPPAARRSWLGQVTRLARGRARRDRCCSAIVNSTSCSSAGDQIPWTVEECCA